MVDEVIEGKQVAGTRLSRYLDQKSLKPFIFKDKGEDRRVKGDSYLPIKKIIGVLTTNT